MPRIVADLGNSRLKWGRVGPDGRLGATVALPTDDPAAWASAWDDWGLAEAGSTWSISSVNPPLADRLGRFLEDRGCLVDPLVPVGGRGPGPSRAGAARRRPGPTGPWRWSGPWGSGRGEGRAWSSRAGRRSRSSGSRATASGKAGRSRPGFGPMAKALHLLTAQLPEVAPRERPRALRPIDRPRARSGRLLGRRRRDPRTC